MLVGDDHDSSFCSPPTRSGNHDTSLDAAFYAEHGLYFHAQIPSLPSQSLALLTSVPNLSYLDHESATIQLVSPSGPKTTFSVFGSPYSPSRGLWAFGYEASAARSVWSAIPLETDIVVTHTPARFHLDESNGEPSGCPALREALWRVRPRLHVCGHVHAGRGAEIIQWDLGCSNVSYKENGIVPWLDSHKESSKISKLDLTARGLALKNDGSVSPQPASSSIKEAKSGSSSSRFSMSSHSREDSFISALPGSVPSGLSSTPSEIESFSPAVLGQGGIPPSGRCDMEALDGRMSRRETCTVNAAIMAQSWEKGVKKSNRRMNKPIVVDLDLPLWDTEME